MKIISLGEVLWDILPSAEHLGGAPFNFALHAAIWDMTSLSSAPWVMMTVAAAHWN